MKVTPELLAAQLEIANVLLIGRKQMQRPQDLPGRYGRVVRDLDRVLSACQIESVVGGGWAVWRHGYIGRVTQDMDIALPADRIEEFLQTAFVSGFERLQETEGRWPKLLHRETGIEVDILPEGGRPGTAANPAPTTIPHPSGMGAVSGRLEYISLPALIELKLAAGRMRDEADVVELIRTNPESADAVRTHLDAVHPKYAERFEALRAKVREEDEA